MSLKEEVFDVLHKDFVNIRPDYKGLEVILCPICLREISRQDIINSGIEHIIPNNIIKTDSNKKTQLGSKNQRCGITVLCRTSRICKSNGSLANSGCNGLKGSLYDRLWKKHWNSHLIDRSQLTHRHGVSILIMAYLGAFQFFGYEYILQDALGEIREQFDFPDERKTNWLDFAQVFTNSGGDNIVVTSSGLPFAMAGVTAPGYPLMVAFRRFRAMLPSGHWNTSTLVSPLLAVKPNL